MTPAGFTVILVCYL